jgi:protein-glutamine gamma-glutamyltransferase
LSLRLAVATNGRGSARGYNKTMLRAGASPAVSVERFFQAALLGLVASGYLAVAGSGYLDFPTVILTAIGLALRALVIFGVVHLEISDRAATIGTIAYSGFYIADYLLLSRDFLQATVHLVFFLAVAKVLTARSSRDHLYTAVIAFLELLAAAILSANFNFFLFLSLYLVFAMAALMSGEIRRSIHRAAAGAASGATARSGLRRFHPRLAALTLFVSAGILAMTAGLFFVLPRTADAAFARFSSHRLHLPGFATQVSLGEIGEIKNSSRAVMHIHLWGQIPGGLKWRGGTLVDFDGRRWSNPASDHETVLVNDGEATLDSVEQRPPRRGINYDVSYDEISTDALFFAGIPQSIRVRAPRIWRVEGGYRLPHPPSRDFHYAAYSLLDEPPEVAPLRVPTPILPLPVRERYLQLPTLDPRIRGLARDATAGLTSDLERARSVERHLREDYGYTLELPDHEVADPLAYFLFTRKKGHCEYFASSMTVMLRALGIPARLATGFQSGLYNGLTDLWLIRASDAHTWVEAWIPGHGWTTFDPTPPDPNPQSFALAARLGLYLDAAETFWQQWVVGYDAGQQGSLADRFEQGARRMGLNWFDSLAGIGGAWKPDRAVAWARQFGVRVVIVLALGAWLWVLGPPLIRLLHMRRRVQRARRGEASVGDATLLYERMLTVLKRRGYQKPAWFTPVEFAASLAGSPLAAPVHEFTTAYNALRFGGRIDVAPRLSALLDELEQSPT